MATLAYITIPKALDQPPFSRLLSVQARYLYGKLRDIHKLSVLNDWRDEMGVYVKIARKTIAELFGISLPTCRKLIAELLRTGLIAEKRVGLTRCNHIYVKPLPGETEEDLLPPRKKGKANAQTTGHSETSNAPALETASSPPACASGPRENEPSKEKPCFTPERNLFASNKRNPKQHNPNEPKKTKNGHFWVFKEGDVFMQEGELWQFAQGEIFPYYTRTDLKRLLHEALPELAG